MVSRDGYRCGRWSLENGGRGLQSKVLLSQGAHKCGRRGHKVMFVDRKISPDVELQTHVTHAMATGPQTRPRLDRQAGHDRIVSLPISLFLPREGASPEKQVNIRVLSLQPFVIAGNRSRQPYGSCGVGIKPGMQKGERDPERKAQRGVLVAGSSPKGALPFGVALQRRTPEKIRPYGARRSRFRWPVEAAKLHQSEKAEQRSVRGPVIVFS